MAITISQIADDTATQLGEEYTSLDVQELFDAWVIEALHELVSETDWGFAKQDDAYASVADTETIALDVGTGEVTAIFRSTDLVRELVRTSKEKLVDDGKDMTVTGEPEYWYPQGMSSNKKVIGLYPIPSEVENYTVRSVFSPESSTRTSTFPLPEDFLPAVRNFVRKLFKEHTGDYAGSDRAGVSYSASLRRLKVKYTNAASLSLRFKASDIPMRGVINHIRFPDTIT